MSDDGRTITYLDSIEKAPARRAFLRYVRAVNDDVNDHVEVSPMHPSPRSLPRSVSLSALMLVGAIALPACKTETTPAQRVCCDQPKIPQGVPAFTVVRDEVS